MKEPGSTPNPDPLENLHMKEVFSTYKAIAGRLLEDAVVYEKVQLASREDLVEDIAHLLMDVFTDPPVDYGDLDLYVFATEEDAVDWYIETLEDIYGSCSDILEMVEPALHNVEDLLKNEWGYYFVRGRKTGYYLALGV